MIIHCCNFFSLSIVYLFVDFYLFSALFFLFQWKEAELVQHGTEEERTERASSWTDNSWDSSSNKREALKMNRLGKMRLRLQEQQNMEAWTKGLGKMGRTHKIQIHTICSTILIPYICSMYWWLVVGRILVAVDVLVDLEALPFRRRGLLVRPPGLLL